MADKRDYYEVLGLNRGASDDEIKKAYRKAAKSCHPDLHPGDKTAEARFKELSEAYEVLSNPDNRARYDQFGHAAFDPASGGAGGGYGGFGGFGDFDLGSIFETFFGGAFSGGGRRTGPQRGESVYFNLSLTFEEAAFGCEKTLEFSRIEKCNTCNGNGTADGAPAPACTTCGGVGQVRTNRRTPIGTISTTAPCSACGGKGRVVQNPCRDCQGSTLRRNKVSLHVKVPAGIDHGQSISLQGQGHGGQNGGPSGDAVIEINVQPHPLFMRDRTAIHCDMPVSITQAALGAELEVPTLDGRVKYTIPEGTQNGTVFRLKGKGVPTLHGKSRGDQFIHISVETPRNLSKKQKRMLEDFADSLGEANLPLCKNFKEKTQNK